MSARQSELTVIVKAKDLAGYVLTVTDKSPKRFRFTLVAKLRGYALDIIEDLYRANEVFVSEGDGEAAGRRLDYQHRAITGMKQLGYMAQLAMERGCILPKQYEQIKRFPGTKLVKHSLELEHVQPALLGPLVIADKTFKRITAV